MKEEVAYTSSAPMEVVKVTEPSKWSFWAILVAVVLIALAGLFLYRWLFQPDQAGATQVDQCNQEWTYERSSDYSDSRVSINFQSSDYEIDVNGVGNYVLQGIWLDVSNDGVGGYKYIGDQALVDYNPSGNEIDWAKVKVKLICPKPTPTPTPTPTPIVCDQEEWSCEECSEKPNDDVCGEYKVGFCREEFSCEYIDDEWGCECPVDPTPSPTPEITPIPTNPPESKPEGCTHDCGIPACTDQIPEAVVNPHVYRNGDSAIVKWYPKDGNRVNIYYRLNSVSEWQHSVQVENSGSFEVKGLGSEDWTFGLQSVNGCSADGIVNASIISEVVDGVSSRWILFR